jgi:hypothetical protein
MIKHCQCCNCKQLAQYEALDDSEQVSFLNSLSTIDKLRVVVNESSYILVDELLINVKVLDMKKLLYHIKARLEMKDCENLHTFTDISDNHIQEIIKLISMYVTFQIDILDDFFESHTEQQNQINLKTLSYMFIDESVFILNNILQTDEQKERYVNVLALRHYIYHDCFRPFVTSDTIKQLVDFHN